MRCSWWVFAVANSFWRLVAFHWLPISTRWILCGGAEVAVSTMLFWGLAVISHTITPFGFFLVMFSISPFLILLFLIWSVVFRNLSVKSCPDMTFMVDWALKPIIYRWKVLDHSRSNLFAFVEMYQGEHIPRISGSTRINFDYSMYMFMFLVHSV